MAIADAFRCRRVVLIAAFLSVSTMMATSAFGQDAAGEADATYEEIQKMIDGLEARVGGMGEAVPPETLETLEKQVEEAVRLLTNRSQENLLLRDKATGLSSELENVAADHAALSDKISDIEKERDDKVAALESRAAEAEAANTEKEAELDKLGRELEAVVAELARLNAQLVDSEDKNVKQQERIAVLDGKLARALASKVEEMARYRSEFFGKLRQVLGERQDIRIVGDRFVFQSEVLFGSGEAVLGEQGKAQLERFADTLAAVAATIPADIDWILRVDGHTDIIPINNEQFRSNWELSTARAVSVVKFLIEHQIAAARLVAAGFGEFHPLDDRNDEIAFRRNRRIEFKLTQK
jgi:chemotaxis protein MotB